MNLFTKFVNFNLCQDYISKVDGTICSFEVAYKLIASSHLGLDLKLYVFPQITNIYVYNY